MVQVGDSTATDSEQGQVPMRTVSNLILVELSSLRVDETLSSLRRISMAC